VKRDERQDMFLRNDFVRNTLEESITILIPGGDSSNFSCEEAAMIPSSPEGLDLRTLEALVGLVASFKSIRVGTEGDVGVLTSVFKCFRLCGKE